MTLSTSRDNEVKRISSYVLQKTNRMIGQIAKSIIIGEKLKMNKTRELTEQGKQYWAKLHAENTTLPKTQEAIDSSPENKERNATKIIEAKEEKKLKPSYCKAYKKAYIEVSEEDPNRGFKEINFKEDSDFKNGCFGLNEKGLKLLDDALKTHDEESLQQDHFDFSGEKMRLNEKGMEKVKERGERKRLKILKLAKKYEEEIILEDKIINGSDKDKKMLPPKKFGYIASKKSFDDLPTHITPEHNPEIEKIRHLTRRIVSDCTELKNINLDDFSFGNLDLFLKDNPKEIIKVNGVHIFSEVLGRSVLLESRPCILSLHAVAKMLFPNIKKLSTIHYNHVLKLFVNNPILKNPYWTEVEHKELGSLKFSSHLLEVVLHKVKGKKYLIFYPNVSFFQGLLVNSERILQSIDGGIVGEIEKKCLSLLGRKNKDSCLFHLVLTLFNHIIHINHLKKTHEKYPLKLDWFIKRNCFPKKLFKKNKIYYGKMSQRVNAAFNAFKHFKIIQDFDYKKGPRAYEDSWIIETQNNQNLFNVKQESSTRLIR